MTRPLLCSAVLAALAACGTPPAPGTAPRPAATPGAVASGATAAGDTLIPAGYGTLRQDDIAIHLDLPGVQARALPLDEGIIRLLSPDSYRSLHQLRESRRADVEALARRAGVQRVRLWYVSFFGLAPDASFSPRELIVTNAGRDYRPVDLLPLTTGFGEQRLRARERQDALYIFDERLDTSQPITVRLQGTQSDEWRDILQRLERERALVRSRSARG